MSSINGSCTCGMTHEEAETIFEPLKFVLENCVSVGINIFGLFANSIAMVVLYSRSLQTLFMKTLFILAIFDLNFNICDILETVRLVYYDTGTCQQMPYSQMLHLYLTPQLIRPLRMFVVVSSMYTTVVIALERYQAVSKPIVTYIGREEDNWKKLCFRLSPVIIVALILTLPKCFEFFIDSTCFLCIEDRKTMELQKQICDNSEVIKTSLSIFKHPKSSSKSALSCKNMDFPEVSDDIYFDNECYFRMMPILQWNEILVNKTYYIIYRLILLNIVTYPIPLFMLFILNWLIYKHIQARRKSINELGKTSSYSCISYVNYIIQN